MKIILNEEEKKEIRNYISRNISGLGILICNKKVSFVFISTFYDNINYDLGSDIVYNFFNVRSEAISEFDEDISENTRIYSVIRNEEEIKKFFKDDVLILVNRPYDEKMVMTEYKKNGDDLIAVSQLVFAYERFISNYLPINENAVDIENDKLKDFISKINSVKPQNMFILNIDGRSMAFISIYGMMAFKEIDAIPTPNIILTTDNAEKIKYARLNNGEWIFYDKDKNIIKIVNDVNTEAYNMIFDRMEIVGKSFDMNKNDFIKILSKINYITSDDKSEFKLNFLKTKIKFSINKNFVVDSCVLEVPTKNSDIARKTFTLSSNMIKDFVEKISSENITFGIHRESVLRINSDDINFMFSELTNKSDD